METESAILTSFLDSLPSQTALLDSQGSIVAVNDAWRRFASANFLQSENFAIGQNYLTICEQAHGDLAEEATQVAIGIRSVLSGGNATFSIEYPCHAPNEPRWFRLMVTRLGVDNPAGAVAMHIEITDRKISEISLKEAELRQRSLVAKLAIETAKLIAAQTAAKIGSWETNLVTSEMTWSLEIFRIFGIGSKDFNCTHDSFLEFVHPDDRAAVNQAFIQSLQTREVCRIDHRIMDSGGHIKFVSQCWQTIFDSTDRPITAFGTCQDISDRVSLESRLRESQRLDSLGQLTGGVAHDFNNLLTIILGNADFLHEQLFDQPSLAQIADIICSAAQSGADLTGRLLSFARGQTLDPRSIDINMLLERLELLLKHSFGGDTGIKIEIVGGNDLWYARADQTLLENALLNICSNSRDAMPDGGRLCITTANVKFDQHDVSQSNDLLVGEFITIIVSDTGGGIVPENLQKVYEPFFTTKEMGKGHGLGLSTVYGFIKQSGGFITIKSKVEVGTTLTIYLPRTLSEPSATDVSHYQAPDASTVILVVEDDDFVRTFAASQLRLLGYIVIEVNSGPNALKVIQQREDIELLFTDIIMPGGMNGHELARAALKHRSELKVLYTSGYNEIMEIEDGGNRNFQLLSKPYRRLDLARKIREALDLRN
jgi:PAS domain S-box-containing protein